MRIMGAIVVCGLASGAAGQTVFSDDFNLENAGVPAVNYQGYDNWAVVSGSTDLIGPGLADVYPGNGLYVDLDGTTSTASTFESTATIGLTPGPYMFAFDLGDTNYLAGSPGTLNSMLVTLLDSGSNVVASSTFASADTADTMMLTQTLSFDVTSSTNLTIRFAHDGPGDNYGLCIDNVSVTRIPAPGSAMMLAGALVLARRHGRA